MIGVDTNTTRDVQVEADAGQMEASANHAGELLGVERCALAPTVESDDQKLSLAEACDRVSGMGILTKPARGFPQYVVTYVVTEGRVDVVNITQVDQNECE